MQHRKSYNSATSPQVPLECWELHIAHISPRVVQKCRNNFTNYKPRLSHLRARRTSREGSKIPSSIIHHLPRSNVSAARTRFAIPSKLFRRRPVNPAALPRSTSAGIVYAPMKYVDYQGVVHGSYFSAGCGYALIIRLAHT